VPPDAAIRAWAGSAQVVGSVGSFQPWHRFDLLVRLISDVLRARPDTRFVVVGGGERMGEIARSLSHLHGRLLCLDNLPHAAVPGVVAAFDVAVAPGCAFYMSPLKIVEWMAAGRAIVAPDHGGVRDIIDSGVHGLLFPPESGEALSAAVLRLLDAAELRRAVGRAAVNRARSALTWHDNARRMVAVCQQAWQGATALRRTGAQTPLAGPAEARP
jgi:glycosyltransferase involved in cell wall biosynthesis